MSLIKRTGSDRWYYRRTIPADVQRILAGHPKQDRPAGWYKTHILISTGTADRGEAKARGASIAAKVERQLKALREGPKPLTIRQVSMLSGIAYRAFAELENNPGLTTVGWLKIAEDNRLAQEGAAGLGAKLGIFRNDDERRRAAMEHRFAGIVDATLKSESIITDSESRWKVIEAVARDLTVVAEKLARNADGDFSPDTYVNRFPIPADVGSNLADKKLTKLADAWHDASLKRGMRPRDAKRWRAVVMRFREWLGHDDLSRLTAQKVQAWGDARNADGITPKTINDTDFAALRAVFDWGRKRGWMAANPAKEARIEGRGRKVTRDKFFSRDEAAAILKTALSVKGSSRENVRTTAAKLWVPWLCAYSGARVMEMIQLRKQDVKKEHGRWVMRVTPEAGNVKTNEFRDVPVHEHLIELGFIKFVSEVTDGPLFCVVGKDGTTDGTASGVYKRVLGLVRGVVSDERVQPNHAWRYTFKTYGYEAGLNDRTLDAICGHAAKTKGQDYTKVTLNKRIEAMDQFPRYSLTGIAPSAAA